MQQLIEYATDFIYRQNIENMHHYYVLNTSILLYLLIYDLYVNTIMSVIKLMVLKLRK